MRSAIFAASVIGALGVAGPAIAGVGQCFDRFGQPWGATYDTDYPNYGFINYVQRRGGYCRRLSGGPVAAAPPPVVVAPPVYRYSYPYANPYPYYYYGYGSPYRYY